MSLQESPIQKDVKYSKSCALDRAIKGYPSHIVLKKVDVWLTGRPTGKAKRTKSELIELALKEYINSHPEDFGGKKGEKLLN